MIAVFDFDKTLTYKDSLWGFYKYYSAGSWLGKIKLCVMFVLMVLHKLKMISNLQLKKAGIYLFLKGEHYSVYVGKAKKYSKLIRTNKVYENEYCVYSEKYVVSASLKEYLLPLFPDAQVIAAEVAVNDGRICGIERNCYGVEKKRLLLEKGVCCIDHLYTDSISDLPLAEMAEDIYLVKSDDVVKCDSAEHFRELLQ